MKQPIRLLVLAALAATVAGTAIAADTTGATTEDTKGHGVYSGEILVTASRTQELLKTEPQSAEVITAKDIQRMGADDVLSALALADNLNLSKAGMTGNSVQLRGMSTNHTLILVDGKRIAGEDASNTTNVYALQRLNVSDIDRIEIVRGPSSSLYGSDAMGGVINVITRVPKKAGGTSAYRRELSARRNTVISTSVNTAGGQRVLMPAWNVAAPSTASDTRKRSTR